MYYQIKKFKEHIDYKKRTKKKNDLSAKQQSIAIKSLYGNLKKSSSETQAVAAQWKLTSAFRKVRKRNVSQLVTAQSGDF